MQGWTVSSLGSQPASAIMPCPFVLYSPIKGTPCFLPLDCLFSLEASNTLIVVIHAHFANDELCIFQKRCVTIVHSLPYLLCCSSHVVWVITVSWLVIHLRFFQLLVSGTDVRKVLEIEREMIILTSTLQSVKVRSGESSSNSFLLQESFVDSFMSVLLTKDPSIRDDCPWYF